MVAHMARRSMLRSLMVGAGAGVQASLFSQALDFPQESAKPAPSLYGVPRIQWIVVLASVATEAESEAVRTVRGGMR